MYSVFNNDMQPDIPTYTSMTAWASKKELSLFPLLPITSSDYTADNTPPSQVNIAVITMLLQCYNIPKILRTPLYTYCSECVAPCSPPP